MVERKEQGCKVKRPKEKCILLMREFIQGEAPLPSLKLICSFKYPQPDSRTLGLDGPHNYKKQLVNH